MKGLPLVLACCAAGLLQGCSVLAWVFEGAQERSSESGAAAVTVGAESSPSVDTVSIVQRTDRVDESVRDGAIQAAPQGLATTPESRPIGAGEQAAEAPSSMPAREPPAPGSAAAPITAAPRLANAESAAVARRQAIAPGRIAVNEAKLAPGRFAAQVGAFRAEASAQIVRKRVAAQLAAASTLPEAERTVRVIRRGSLFHVVVGEAANAGAAAALVARVSNAIGQHVVVFRP